MGSQVLYSLNIIFIFLLSTQVFCIAKNLIITSFNYLYGNNNLLNQKRYRLYTKQILLKNHFTNNFEIRPMLRIFYQNTFWSKPSKFGGHVCFRKSHHPAYTCSYYNDVTYSNKPRPSVGLEMLWLEQRIGVVQQHPPLEDLISSSTHTLAVPGRVDTELQVNKNLWFVPFRFHALCLLPFLCVVYYLSYLEHSLLVLNNYFLGRDTKIYHHTFNSFCVHYLRKR